MNQFKGENRDEFAGGEYLDDCDSENVIEMGSKQIIESDGKEISLYEPTDNKGLVFPVTIDKIAEWKRDYAVVPADLTVKADYDKVKKVAIASRKKMVEIDKRRLALNEEARKVQNKNNSDAKSLINMMEEVFNPWIKARTDHDTKVQLEQAKAAAEEERRQKVIEDKKDTIISLPIQHISSNSETIKLEIEKLTADTVETWAAEHVEVCKKAHESSLAKLQELYTMKLQQETAETDRLAAEAKRKEEEEAARIAREAEVEKQRLELEAERNRLAAENEKIRKAAADKAAADKAIQDEKDRVAEEKRKAELAAQVAKDAEAKRIQDQKDAEAAAKIADMEAKLKVAQEAAKPKTIYSPAINLIAAGITEDQNKKTEEGKKETGETSEPASPQQPTTSYTLEEYRSAGNAMLAFICNKSVTKALLDAIISGKVKNIYFQGEKS